MPDGFVRLCPDATVVVDPNWLQQQLASVRKTKKTATTDLKGATVKKLMDGFFSLDELCVPGGNKVFEDTPIFLSLRCKLEIKHAQGYLIYILNDQTDLILLYKYT